MLVPGRIMTFTGMLFDIASPEADDFRIEDIAHALSLNCRYGGHCRSFYSVAQHSFYASYMVKSEMAKAALLHDATEAYMHDLPRPLKALLPDYKKLELALGCKIALAFDLPVCAFEDPDIKVIDNRLMALEATVLVNNPKVIWDCVGGIPDGSMFDIDQNFHGWTPDMAERAFLSRFNELRLEGL